jgi:hypothetical protein
MRKKLLSILALLCLTVTSAWAQYADYDIHVDFTPYYDPMQTDFHCMIMNMMEPWAEIKGTLDLSVDGVSKGSFDVDGEMVDGQISPGLDAGDHTYEAVFHPEGGGSFSKNGNFTIDKAYSYITYYGSTSINMGVGESTELDAYLGPNEAGELSYSSSDASVASITKKEYGYNEYIIQAKAAGTATITFSFAGNTNYKAADKDKTITVTVWPAIDVTANEGATGQYWATFYSNAMNYQAPEGTQVFKVNLTGTAIEMTEITDRIVKSGQGVVLKKTASGSITMTPTSSNSSDDYSGNSLVGTMTNITNPGNAYVLNNKNGIGFYKLKSTGTIGANKAYLTYSGASAPEFFGFGETTSISEIEKMRNVENETFYDLQGRRVAQPTKGLYIVNGKKVVIK